MSERETIFALASGRAPAAISIIRISGPNAHEAGSRLAGSLPKARSAALREIRDPASGERLDQALVLKFDSPASATGENMVEIQCHGGRAVVDAILGALTSLPGLRLARSGEFTRRAFENGRINLTEAEGLADLIEAETQYQRRAALALAEGGLRREIAQWQQSLLALSARAERAIDYDEADETIGPDLALACGELATRLVSWLEQPRAEPLKDGIRIVIAGPPNSGKSSLLNALAGSEKAIVTEIAGTTRDSIEVPLSLGGAPVLLIDTAGLRESDDRVEAIGVARAEALVGRADILLWLGPPNSVPDHSNTVLVHARADLPERNPVPAGSLAISSRTGQGLAELFQQLEKIARTLLPAEGAIALNRRQADHIGQAADALSRAARTEDVLLIAEDLRAARSDFDRLTGAAGLEDVLDSLFSRFCLGK